MIEQPRRFPDKKIYPGDLPAVWTIVVLQNWLADVSDLTFIAPVTDDGEPVGNLVIDATDAVNGRIGFTLNQELFDKLGRYSTWRLRETTMYRVPLVEGRLIKAV